MKISQANSVKSKFPKQIFVSIQEPGGENEWFNASGSEESLVSADGEFIAQYELVKVRKAKLSPVFEG